MPELENDIKKMVAAGNPGFFRRAREEISENTQNLAGQGVAGTRRVAFTG